jgi:GNAT acetyltransferase-like protein
VTTLRLATPADDALLRSILRSNGMPTWVDMAIEREPSFFAAKDLYGRDWAVIAEDNDEVVGMYTASVLPVHVNGRLEQVGYLGGLRVNAAHRRRIRYLREGYASIEPLAPTCGTVAWWFTVVAAENHSARRLFEAGIKGLPAYHLQGDYVTYALPTARGRRLGLWRQADEADLNRMLELHNRQAACFHYSPVLDRALVGRIGRDRFYLHEQDGAILALAALWDQRAFKQVVARRYRAPVGAFVPCYNLYARLSRRIPLPRAGGALDQTFIAFLAIAEGAMPMAASLLQDLLSLCETPAASIGLHGGHALTDVLERFKPIRYPAKVYAVSFDQKPAVDLRPAQPEAALL